MKSILKNIMLSIMMLCLFPSFYLIDEQHSSALSDLTNVTSTDTVLRSPLSVTPFNLSILPPSSGIQFYKEGIIFLGSTKSENNMTSSHVSFGKINICYAVLKDSVMEDRSLFSPSVSFYFPCEAITFTGDYRTMYFTRYCENDGVEKIYRARLSPGSSKEGDWIFDDGPLSFCTGKYTYTHPALSADGNIMIFASNKPGSLGGMDLFISQNNNGTWSTPVNMGNAINTTSNELFPFIDSENNLFFSSDGMMGYGGYDIFICKFKSNTWEKPLNLSLPVNTIYDDVAFTLNRKDGKSGFYTVRQRTGSRTRQLFRVALNTESATPEYPNLSQFFASASNTQIVFLVAEPAVEATKTDRSEVTESGGTDKEVIYRVQILTSFNPRTRSNILINNKDYTIFEYLYSGAYRLCIGEFTSFSQAKALQDAIRNEYPQAIVVPFVDNVRSLDPELLQEKQDVAAVRTSEVTKPKTNEEQPTKNISSDTKTVILAKETEKPQTENVKTETTQAVKTEPAKPVERKPETSTTATQKGKVTYRIQLISTSKPAGSYKIAINNVSYNTFEYVYKGLYRTCVGDFSSLTAAKELQNICRKSGYPQAFVVAFVDDVRSVDPELFK